MLVNILNTFAQGLRPFTKLRGSMRICRIARNIMLWAGASPIRIANMSDGTQMRVDLRSQTEWFTFFSGRYDDDIIFLISRLVSRLGGDFADVGANIGMYAVRVASCSSGVFKSFCFEPMPANVQRIRSNAALNGLGDRIVVHELALSDHEGEAELVLREDFELGSATGNASLAISDAADGTFMRINVATKRFDNVLVKENILTIPIIKVDIEGHEDLFLEGARIYLDEQRPIIFSEINNWFYEKRGKTSSEVFGANLPEGYSVARLDQAQGNLAVNWIRFEQLAGLRSVENVVFCPDEKRTVLESAAEFRS